MIRPKTIISQDLWLGSNGDNAVLYCSQHPKEDLLPIHCEEAEIAVTSWKKELCRSWLYTSRTCLSWRGDHNYVLTEFCYRIWRAGEWPAQWILLLIITFPKMGNLQLCQKYRTISLINHSSKVMLKVILNRFNPQVEKIIAEEQAGLRARMSTTELWNPVWKVPPTSSSICTMSSLIPKKPLTEYSIHSYGPPCVSTISMQF